MARSTDRGATFGNVSTPHAVPKDGKLLVDGGEFDCADECGSWTVFELLAPDHGLPAGVFTFTDNVVWHSSDMARSFHRFGNASGFAGRLPRVGSTGGSEFFSQSQVYRRKDGVFLHGARWNTAPCDDLAGSQLWRSSGTTGVAPETWRCTTQAAGGYCNPDRGRKCYSPADNPAECAEKGTPMFLKPGNHYSHMLRLRDGRLLLTWTHRSNLIDDDGYGTGSRGLLSSDDGDSWDFGADYIVIKAQDESTPAAVKSGCAPSAGGCGCGVGYGNTLQLEDGRLLTATSFDIGNSLDIALWALPPPT
jgi:hypothetical protein